MGSAKTKKLLRSNSPEVARCIASARALASCWSAAVFAYLVIAWGLLIALAAGLILPVRIAIWVGVPAFAALSAYLLWCLRSPRRNWKVAGRAGQMYIRLPVRQRKGRGDDNKPDILVLENSEIVSMSIRRREVLLRGRRRKILEWLVIEPAQAATGNISDLVPPLPKPPDPIMRIRVASEGKRIAVGWMRCHPALGTFLQQVLRECPYAAIGDEDHSELDLNRIWVGISMDLSARQRQLLVQASRLGFGPECRRLLSRYKYISFQKSQRFLAELESEEAATGQTAVQS